MNCQGVPFLHESIRDPKIEIIGTPNAFTLNSLGSPLWNRPTRRWLGAECLYLIKFFYADFASEFR